MYIYDVSYIILLPGRMLALAGALDKVCWCCVCRHWAIPVVYDMVVTNNRLNANSAKLPCSCSANAMAANGT